MCCGLRTSLLMAACVLIAWGEVAEADGVKEQGMAQSFHSSNLPRAYVDYSMFHFVPRGDKMIEQPEQARLLFRTPTGQPDGYAERRGSTVFYYDRTGKAVRVQRLTFEEINRLNRTY